METSAPSRPTCPHCGATVYVGAHGGAHGGMPWCTLCYRPLDEPPPAEVAEPAGELDDLDECDDLADLADLADRDGLGVHPGPTGQHVEPRPDVEALADEMIARLAASVDAPLGDGLSERLSSRVPQSTPARVGFMTGVGAGGCLLLLLALWLLGLLL